MPLDSQAAICHRSGPGICFIASPFRPSDPLDSVPHSLLAGLCWVYHFCLSSLRVQLIIYQSSIFELFSSLFTIQYSCDFRSFIISRILAIQQFSLLRCGVLPVGFGFLAGVLGSFTVSLFFGGPFYLCYASFQQAVSRPYSSTEASRN